MSIYIHIPFCTKICSYCDFPKVIKNNKWIDEYLKALENEIISNYKGEIINTVYIGGGTPTSLDIKYLKKLFSIIKKLNIKKNAEITIEANSEDLTDEKLKLLKQNVNRLSIGVQTFNEKILTELNRKVNIKNIEKAFNYFDNINIDLMYGFKNQSMDILKKDIKKIIKLNPTHISTYSLILEPNTKLFIDNYTTVSEDTDRKMYEYICKQLTKNGYIHYEISNFAKKKYKSIHNQVYWNNQHYYGFGLGASGYIDNIRYENTRSLTKYLHGQYKLNEHELDINETIQNEFILGLRKTNGIDKNNFKKKYNIQISNINIVKELISNKLLIETDKIIYINPDYLYISNEILINFIDFTLHEQ